MSKETKSPFELRLEIINTARDLLEKQFALNKEIAMATWNLSVEAAKTARGSVPDAPSLTYPTIDDVLELATKMNDFISGKAKS